MQSKSMKVLKKLGDGALHAELIRAMDERGRITNGGINTRNQSELARLDKYINTVERLLRTLKRK